MVGAKYLPLLALSLSTLSWAQNLTEVLDATPDLSTLNTILKRYPGVLDNLSSLGATLLAPSNAALNVTISSVGGTTNLTPDFIQNLISYHLVPAQLNRANLTVAGGRVVDTTLVDENLANLAGNPNVVFASSFGSTGQETEQGQLKIYSGVGDVANVTQADINFDGGVVHVIDHVLNLPRPCTQTAEAAELTTLIGAFRTGKLWQTIDQTAKFTCFAPTDEAFQASGINLESMSADEVGNLLKYHSIVGEVGYSTSLEDGKEYATMLGPPVTVRKRDDQLFINDVAVQTGNIIMTNGVAHILSGVLVPPANATSPGSGTTSGSAGGASATTPGGAGSNGATPVMDSRRSLVAAVILTYLFMVV